MHKSQVFFYLLSAFILGVFTASLLNFSQSVIYIILIAGIGIISLFGLRSRWLLLVAFMLIAFVGGLARFNSFNSMQGDLIDLVGQEVTLNGYIDSEPEIDGNRARFVLKAGQDKILITTNTFPKREFGDKLLIKGKLELPQNFTEFDYITYLKKDGIRMIIFYPKEIKETGVSLRWSEKIKVSIYRHIFVVKNKFENAINLSISEPNAAFINGILLGTRQGIPDDLKEAFSRTGTTHILAISGYNIMIISWAVLMGLVWFFRRRTAFWISVGVIILFVILTGASASVVRAAVMGLLLSFANGYGRLYDQKNSIILAGGIMIYHNPMVLVFDIGFQLSFAAVLGLIYLYPWLERKVDKVWKLVSILYPDPKDRGHSIAKQSEQNRGSSISQSNHTDLREIGRGLKELILMTISAQLAVLPLILYYFGNFSPWSLPANILILPFIPAAMLFGFITGLVGMISLSLGHVVSYIAWAITEYQIGVVRYLSL